MQRVEITKSRLDFTQFRAGVARCLRQEVSRSVIGSRPQVVKILVCSGEVGRNEMTLKLCQRFFDGKGIRESCGHDALLFRVVG